MTEREKIDREQIDRLLRERAQALGIASEALAQEVGGQTLEALLGDLIEQTVREVHTRERETLAARQRAGREAAAQAGVVLGRPSKQPGRKRLDKICGAYTRGELTAEQAAQRLHVSVSTFYRWLRQQRQEE